jgi:release factor glutamine methyltransferase
VSGIATLRGHSLDAARRALTAAFRDHGIESPELDARLLIGHALGLDLTGLIVAAARTLNAEDARSIEVMAERRLAGEPVARILGHKEFWGLTFELSPATLVPRPDTETLVEVALKFTRDANMAAKMAERPIRIADIGTGTGAILLALLSELPQARGIGTDISHDALATATRNAERLGLLDRADFVESDYASALDDPFDLIVSNPPYIRSRDIDGLPLDVRAHDPHLALDGGDDGLEAYRAIAPQAARLLRPDAALVVEIGQGQADEVIRIFAAAGLIPDGAPKVDLAGIGRVILARKPAI